VPFDHSIWGEIVSKVQKVQHYTNAGEMPPWEETSAVKNQQECTECGFRKLCAPPIKLSAPAFGRK
jgi:radical SAM protein with 4Fe4S-binding SPASM domain